MILPKPLQFAHCRATFISGLDPDSYNSNTPPTPHPPTLTPFVQSSKIFYPDPEQMIPAPTTGAYLEIRAVDLDSLNPDPDPAFQVNPDQGF